MPATTSLRPSARNSRTVLGFGFALGLLVGIGMLVGSWMTISRFQPQIMFPETALHATATDSGETFAIATGPITDGVEGIFCLDFLTGELQCWVINNRARQVGQVGGYFVHNVVPDLGVDQTRKNPKYLMVTGMTGMRGGSQTQPAECVLYVADANSGNIVAYAIPWIRAAATRGPQQGRFTPIFKQAARRLEIRGE